MANKRTDRDGKLQAILYKVGGDHAICMPAGKIFTDKEIGKLVGGFFEIMPTKDDRFVLLVNEDGRLHNLPFNQAAADLSTWGVVVGDALYCPKVLLQELMK